jgi:hypothetical protein
MRLFNVSDLIKMVIQDPYELVLFKLTCKFFYKSGHVKLRGDQYVYRGIPVVTLEDVGGNCFVTLYDPFNKTFIKTSTLQMDSIKDKSFIIKPGEECTKEVFKIDAHIAHINLMHVKKPIKIMP